MGSNNQTQLVAHFDEKYKYEHDAETGDVANYGGRTRDVQIAGWTTLWETNNNDLWDRGKPSPALIDFIETHPNEIPKRKDGHNLKVLVPGCGKGYDVVMLALHGFDVWGLEVSEKGVDVARSFARAELNNPSERNWGDAAERSAHKVGSVNFVHGDFFKRTWEDQFNFDDFQGFDMIYDYTFLCALLPEMRADWASRMSELLAPTGILVCLEFPMWKDLKSLGPPWGLNGVHWKILAEGADGTVNDDSTLKSADKCSSGAFERVHYWKPPRSYEQGRGMDMLSVWKLKRGQQIATAHLQL